MAPREGKRGEQLWALQGGVKGDNETLAVNVGINMTSENTGAENQVFVQLMWIHFQDFTEA